MPSDFPDPIFRYPIRLAASPFNSAISAASAAARCCDSALSVSSRQFIQHARLLADSGCIRRISRSASQLEHLSD